MKYNDGGSDGATSVSTPFSADSEVEQGDGDDLALTQSTNNNININKTGRLDTS